MGKPFKKELTKITETYKWASTVELDFTRDDLISLINTPTFAVGSGGSFSACHLFSLLHQARGGFCKPVTPLELYNATTAIRKSNVAFLSASGRNSDILFAYTTAVKNDARNVFGFCMKKGTPLSSRASNHSISKIVEYPAPAGKDGFLATNSLVAYFTLLPRLFGFEEITDHLDSGEQFEVELNNYVERLDPDFTITVLYSGWSQPVAVDIESKFTEAGLGNILLSDFRNFGHGRHNWFDKKRRQSAIIALITPEESKLAEKTLALLPGHIPVLKVSTALRSHLSTLHLLIQSFSIVAAVGEKVGIDPGRPGVPAYGSKLYHLRYQTIIDTDRTSYVKDNAILRKASRASMEDMDMRKRVLWMKRLYAFKEKMKSQKFGSLIVDYDGTVCTKEQRRTIPSEPIVQALNTFLNKGFVLGVVSGRGQSIRTALQSFIVKKHWKNVVVGYYNGAEIGLLDDDSLPDTKKKVKKSLQQIYDLLQGHSFLSGKPELTLRPLQLTIESGENCDWIISKNTSLEIIAKSHCTNIQILESGHSVDVISKPEVSKINIIPHCVALSKLKKLAEQYICIGDKGQYPGNDYELLTTEYSLSVDEVSSDPDKCWNLSEPGNRGAATFLQYLQSISYHKNHFTIAL